MNKDSQNVPMICNESSIILPIDEDAFKEFMVSLLGQPESIEGYTEGAFEIDTGDFNYLNQLIDERITTQNLSSLIEFRAKLFFNDNTSMTFNGVQSFLDFHDLRPVICEGFIFTWSYLVKFNNKKSSEKQEISVSSVEEKPYSSQKSKKKSSPFNFDVQVDKVPKILSSVRCTDRSWGIEITELIRKCLFNIVKIDSSPWINLRKIIIENFGVVQYLLIILSSIFVLFIMFTIPDSNRNSCYSLSNAAEKYVSTTIPVGDKINFLVKVISSCNKKPSLSFLFFVLPMIILSSSYTILPWLIYRTIQLPSYRFILFTKESKKLRDEYFRKLKDRKNFWIVAISIGLIIGIISGVLGNYIFSFLNR